MSRSRWGSGGRLGIAAVLLALVLMALPANAPRAETITAIGTAEPSDEPGYEGYWRYCLDVSWDVVELGNHGMSFVSLFIGLGECPCACTPGVMLFPQPAGVATGEGGCQVPLTGIYDCHGDPHFPEFGPSVKFEPVEDGCQPGATGTARVCFYSMFDPAESADQDDVLGIKSSTRAITGDFTGAMPECLCASPTEETSWGVMKTLYR